MENKDFNFEEIKRRLENYEEVPNPKMWKNIEKQIQPNNFFLKTAIALSSLLLVAFVGVLIFTPSQEPQTKQISQAPKIEKTPIKQEEKKSKKNEIFSKKKIEKSKKKSEKSKENFEQTNLVEQQVVKVEPQELKPIEVKQESQIQTPKIAEAKPQKAIEKVEVKPIVEQKVEKSPEVEEQIQKVRIEMPNAFTPSSGDRNSIFKPANIELKEFRMDIYNSNGVMMFTTNNIEEGWDGTYKGNPQPMAVYVYIVKFTNKNGVTATQKGELMLIR